MLLLTPAHASAASSTIYRFEFKTHGYVVAAIGERATVVIGVSRNEHSRHRGAETDYFARGTASGGLRAVFPGIGRIAMHFEPMGQWHPVAHCAPKHPRLQRAGVFTGKLRFVGEHRYLTAVRRTSPRQRVEIRSRLSLDRRSTGRSESAPRSAGPIRSAEHRTVSGQAEAPNPSVRGLSLRALGANLRSFQASPGQAPPGRSRGGCGRRPRDLPDRLCTRPPE